MPTSPDFDGSVAASEQAGSFLAADISIEALPQSGPSTILLVLVCMARCYRRFFDSLKRGGFVGIGLFKRLLLKKYLD